MPYCYEDNTTEQAIKPAWYLDTHFIPGKPTFRVLYCHGSFASYSVKNLAPEDVFRLQYGQHVSYQSNFPFIDDAPSIKATFSIDASTVQACRVGDFIPAFSDSDIPPWFPTGFRHLFEEFRRQYCFLCESDGDKFIFPCALIGSIYFFVSQSLAHHVFAQSLGMTDFETAINNENGSAAIEVPNNILAIDAYLFARIRLDEMATKEANRILNQIRARSSEISGKQMLPLMINFPFKQVIKFSVEALELRLNGKNIIYYVQSIVKEDSRFPFSTLIIRKVGGIRDRNVLPKLSDLVKTPVRNLLNGTAYPELSYHRIRQLFPDASLGNENRNKLLLIKEAY